MRYLAATLVLLSTAISAADLPASELSIGGISSGATEASVLEQRGTPDHRIENGEGTELHYPGLVVTVGWLEPAAPGVERRVYALRGDGAAACTPKGLCPGMDLARAKELYGQAEPVVRETGTFLEYPPAGLSCWLQISAPEGEVESLAVVCQP